MTRHDSRDREVSIDTTVPRQKRLQERRSKSISLSPTRGVLDLSLLRETVPEPEERPADTEYVPIQIDAKGQALVWDVQRVSNVEQARNSVHSIVNRDRRVSSNGMLASFRSLVQTEQAYVDKLHVLYYHFKRGLLAYVDLNFEEAILSVPAIKDIFLSCEELLSFSERLLRQLKRLNTRKLAEKLLRLFQERREKLTVLYSTFSTGFSHSMELVKHFMRTKPSFAHFVQRTEYASKHKLSALLTEPIQRLIQYSFFIKQMQSSCKAPSSHLDETLDILQAITMDVEANTVDFMARDMVVILQRRLFRDKVSLITPERRCIRFSYLKKVSMQRTSKFFRSDDRYFFILFNDHLSYCQVPRKKSAAAHLRHCIPLTFVRVIDLEDTETLFHRFEVRNTLKSIVLCADSLDIKMDWIRCIEAAVQENSHQNSKALPMSDEVEHQVFVSPDPSQIPDRLIVDGECPWIYGLSQ